VLPSKRYNHQGVMRFPSPMLVFTVAALVGCSRHRAAPADRGVRQTQDDPPPLPRPVRVHVDYQGGMSKGETHAITQTAVLARLASLVNAQGSDWVDPYTQMLDVPIRQLRLEWTSESAPYGATVDIGENWIGREGLIQDIPVERASEILDLVRTLDSGDAGS
jgi:hypothetical protein